MTAKCNKCGTTWLDVRPPGPCPNCKLEELLPLVRKLSRMVHHWKVPNLPEVYREPMARLIEAAGAEMEGTA